MVALDRIKTPKEISNLKKTIFLTADILFVNGIPSFIFLSRKIDFTGVSHPKERTAAIIFNDFKAIFRFYLHQGSRIQTVHADGELGALKDLIKKYAGRSQSEPDKCKQTRARNREKYLRRQR